MVANVSHELRTPVAALRAQLENLADGVTQPTPQALDAALGQAERLSELIGYLLDLSRLEAGAVGLSLSEVDLHGLISDTVAEVDAAARATGRDVRWHVAVSPSDLRLYADARRLRQVLRARRDNAARATPTGSAVTSRARARALPGEVIVDVVHSEAGIPQADRHRIFER